MIKLNGTPINITLFPDNTSQVWRLDKLTFPNCQWADIIWEFSSESEFMHLAQLKTLLDQHDIRSYLTIKYLPYGRQDKEVTNETTFALRTFARLLNSLHFNNVTILDPHSPVATAIIQNSIAYYPIAQLLKARDLTNSNLFCYPDKGAQAKYSLVYDFPSVYCNKVRDQLTGNILSNELTGNVEGKTVLIVDDICDGGMTFIKTAELLYAAGAKEVSLFVSHGIFSKGLKPILNANIKHVFTSDGEASEHQQQINYRRL